MLVFSHVWACNMHIYITQGMQLLANDSLGRVTKNKPGFITRVNDEGDACMVMWDAVRPQDGGESGWYRAGECVCAYMHVCMSTCIYVS